MPFIVLIFNVVKNGAGQIAAPFLFNILHIGHVIWSQQGYKY